MNKQDYKAIAKIISKTIPQNPVLTIFVYELADYFEKEKENMHKYRDYYFNKKQFLKDCGVE